MEEKKWFRKFKVQVGIATIVIETAIFVAGQIIGVPLSPAVIQIMQYVFAFGMVIIGGHSLTDAFAALGKTKK